MDTILFTPVNNSLPIPEGMEEYYSVYRKLVDNSNMLSGMMKESKEVMALSCTYLHSAMVECQRIGRPSAAARHAKDLISIVMKIDQPSPKEAVNMETNKQVEWIKEQRVKNVPKVG